MMMINCIIIIIAIIT